MGPSDETLIDELRVIGAVAEPPEVAPGGSIDLTATVLDPLGDGVELVIWACTPTGDGCAEDRLDLSDRLAVPAVDGVTATATFTVPRVPLRDDVAASGIVWLLACAPGLCPVIADARAALATDSAFPSALRDPVTLLQGLPLTGVSLATRTVIVSERATPNTNPVVTLDEPLPSRISADEPIDLPLSVVDDTVSDELIAIGLTTGGGFAAALFDVLDGRADLTYFAPAESGVVDLYVVIEDGHGGSAVWSGRTTVE